MHSFTTLFCAILTDLRGAIAHIAARDRAPFLTFFCARISPTAQLFDLFERLLAEWRNGTLPDATARHPSPAPAFGSSPNCASPPPPPISPNSVPRPRKPSASGPILAAQPISPPTPPRPTPISPPPAQPKPRPAPPQRQPENFSPP